MNLVSYKHSSFSYQQTFSSTLNHCFCPKYESIIYNNASSSEKVHPMLSFHNKIHISFNYKWCLICAYFSSGSNNITFTEESNIMDFTFSQKQKFEVKNFLYMDLFITKMHLFASQSINWWTGVVWCGLLWCFYQLFQLSFWRHPFTAMDPLVSM